MKKIIKLILLCQVMAGVAMAQTGWKMQPVQMQSRWAKEVSPANTYKEYPRPGLKRADWINFNGLWDYRITNLDDKKPESYTGKILVPYPIESALSGVKKPLLPTQNLWYRKTFQYAKPVSDDRTWLNFGAVDWKATIYVNGNEIGSHQGGYTAFSFDITDALKIGLNEIAVKVFDPTDQGIGPHGKQVLNPANIYYTPSSGIWQTVWLETVPRDHIDGLILTPDIDKSVVNIRVNARTQTTVKLTVEGKIVKFRSNTDTKIPINNVKLWSPSNPYLYNITVQLGRDIVKSYFGMRKVAIQKDQQGIDRICLNNKFTYNLGTLDQGFWPEGLYTAPNDEALAFDIRAIKTMGFNTIRKHIKVEPANWYYNADKIGVLVWQDMVNPNQNLPMGSREEFERESNEIVTQLHNYPSITTYVLFNEKWGQYDQERLTAWLKALDPSRIVNGHSGEYLYVGGELRSPSPNAYVNADMTDVHSYPNPRMPERQKGKALVCGEFGGIGVSVPGHEWSDLQGWGYIQVMPRELENQYESMVKQLKIMISEGLSGSIYTQPFDVEGEENGLMTYDRDIIKIPLKRLREINGDLLALSNGFQIPKNFYIAKPIDRNDTDERYPELIDEYEKGKRDSIFLRRLTLMAIRKQDQVNATRFGNSYVENLKTLFSYENLFFINHITRTSKDAGFKIFFKERDRVNQILGSNRSESKLREVISIEEIQPNLKLKNVAPDWKNIEALIGRKYGEIGLEKVYGSQMVYYLDHNDWANFGKYYGLYFKTAYSRSEYHINNMSWSVFEKISDKKILETAISAMKYSIEHFDQTNYQAFDTYANLLYKYGKKTEALEWEEKALKAQPNDREMQAALSKMKKGEQTWPN